MELPSGPPSLTPGGAPPPPAAADPSEPTPVAPPTDGLLADEDRNRRLVATTAAAALVAVAVMIATFLVTRDDGPAPAPPPEVAVGQRLEDDGATAATEPPATVPADHLAATLEEIEAFVAEERGRDFREEVELTLLDREAYEDRVRQEFDEDIAGDEEVVAAIRQAAAVYQALGAWPAGTDPVGLLREFNAVGSLGFYDPVTDEMVVAGGEITPLLRTTLAHELTHALDDQWFDLDRPDLDARTDEASMAFSAVVEGSARQVESAYEATLSDEEQADSDAEAQALIDGIDLSRFPSILILEQQFVYEGGQAFVADLLAAEGEAGLARALRRPPRTTEAIQEVDTWLTEGPTAPTVPVPEADGAVEGDGVLGQFLVDQLTAPARVGTDGQLDGTVPEWDGDRYVLWADGDQWCVRAAVLGDVDALAEQLGPWADQVGAELDPAGDELVVTSCN